MPDSTAKEAKSGVGREVGSSLRGIPREAEGMDDTIPMGEEEKTVLNLKSRASSGLTKD